jgi:hypothetical protein
MSSRHLLSIIFFAILVATAIVLYNKYNVWSDRQPPQSYVIQPWMEEAVRKELVPIHTPITQQQLDHTLNKIEGGYAAASIVRFQIIDGVLYGTPLWENASTVIVNNYGAVIKALRHIAASGELSKNVDFLVSLYDLLPEHMAYLEQGELAPILVATKKIDAMKIVPGRPYEILYPDGFSLRWKRYYRRIKSSHKDFLNRWHRKKDLVFWNGTNSSGGDYSLAEVEKDPRIHLVRLAKERPDLVQAGFIGYFPHSDPAVDTYIETTYPKVDKVSLQAHQRYKYLITLDGVTCTYPGYLIRLASSSVTVKQETDNIQWFYHILKPYVHYVPVKADLSDLEQQIAYMRAHDEEIQVIVKNANHMVEENLKIEHLYGYLVELLNQYASKQGFVLTQPTLQLVSN